jgi:hypothetical protein
MKPFPGGTARVLLLCYSASSATAARHPPNPSVFSTFACKAAGVLGGVWCVRRRFIMRVSLSVTKCVSCACSAHDGYLDNIKPWVDSISPTLHRGAGHFPAEFQSRGQIRGNNHVGFLGTHACVKHIIGSDHVRAVEVLVSIYAGVRPCASAVRGFSMPATERCSCLLHTLLLYFCGHPKYVCPHENRPFVPSLQARLGVWGTFIQSYISCWCCEVRPRPWCLCAGARY